MNKECDPLLWSIARERVKFRYQLYRFLAINSILWLIWLLNNLWDKWKVVSLYGAKKAPVVPWTFPWPLYITLIWAVFLLLGYLKVSAINKEYSKLKEENEQK